MSALLTADSVPVRDDGDRRGRAGSARMALREAQRKSHPLPCPVVEGRVIARDPPCGATRRDVGFATAHPVRVPQRAEEYGAQGIALEGRKPRDANLVDELTKLRNADCRVIGMFSQLPPRNKRDEPIGGPVGSVTGPAGYGPCLSSTHSHPFPAVRRCRRDSRIPCTQVSQQNS